MSAISGHAFQEHVTSHEKITCLNFLHPCPKISVLRDDYMRDA